MFMEARMSRKGITMAKFNSDPPAWFDADGVNECPRCGQPPYTYSALTEDYLSSRSAVYCRNKNCPVGGVYVKRGPVFKAVEEWNRLQYDRSNMNSDEVCAIAAQLREFKASVKEGE
jgi:hypothetical protein